jgi:hypothetical protein
MSAPGTSCHWLMLGLENPGPSRPVPRDGAGAKDPVGGIHRDPRTIAGWAGSRVSLYLRPSDRA